MASEKKQSKWKTNEQSFKQKNAIGLSKHTRQIITQIDSI